MDMNIENLREKKEQHKPQLNLGGLASSSCSTNGTNT